MDEEDFEEDDAAAPAPAWVEDERVVLDAVHMRAGIMVNKRSRWVATDAAERIPRALARKAARQYVAAPPDAPESAPPAPGAVISWIGISWGSLR
jgi:hypothetical protein